MADSSEKTYDNRLPPIHNRPVPFEAQLPSIKEAISAQAEWEISTRPAGVPPPPTFTPINSRVSNDHDNDNHGGSVPSDNQPIDTCAASENTSIDNPTGHASEDMGSSAQAGKKRAMVKALHVGPRKPAETGEASSANRKRAMVKALHVGPRKPNETGEASAGSRAGETNNRTRPSRQRVPTAKGGEKWTSAEKIELLRLRGQGMLHREIGQRLGRSDQSCRLTLHKMLITNARPARELAAVLEADVEMGEATEVNSDVEMEEEAKPETMSSANSQADTEMETPSQPETEQQDAASPSIATPIPAVASGPTPSASEMAPPAHDAADVEGAENLLGAVDSYMALFAFASKDRSSDDEDKKDAQ